jgi:hypothetical protein
MTMPETAPTPRPSAPTPSAAGRESLTLDAVWQQISDARVKAFALWHAPQSDAAFDALLGALDKAREMAAELEGAPAPQPAPRCRVTGQPLTQADVDALYAELDTLAVRAGAQPAPAEAAGAPSAVDRALQAFVPGAPDIAKVRALELPESATATHDAVLVRVRAGDRVRHRVTGTDGRAVHIVEIVERPLALAARTPAAPASEAGGAEQDALYLRALAGRCADEARSAGDPAEAAQLRARMVNLLDIAQRLEAHTGESTT